MLVKSRLSISFHNCGAFSGVQHFVRKALAPLYEVHVEPVGRDIQFFSVFGQEFPEQVLHSDALKVWITGENRDPRHVAYDLYFGFQRNPLLGARSIRFPLWIFYIDWWDRGGPLSIEALTGPRRFAPRERFCNFIYSKDASYRAEIFYRFNERRRVDSLGGVLNNVGARVGDKLEALSRYQFTLAFENMLAPGYVTEKILQPLAAGSIPIYWGAPEAKSDFNPACFVDANAFDSVEALIDHVLALASDEAAMRAMVEAPIFQDGVPTHHTPDFFAQRISEALDSPALRAPGLQLNAALAPRQTFKIKARAVARRVRKAFA